MPKLGSEGHGKSGHLSDRLRRKAPRRYFTFTFTMIDLGLNPVPSDQSAGNSQPNQSKHLDDPNSNSNLETVSLKQL